MNPETTRIVLRGGGEMGSGVAWRLHRCGYLIVIAECAQPTAIRRWVCFSEAVYNQRQTVEGVTAILTDGPERIDAIHAEGCIPVMVVSDRDALAALTPTVVIDATLAKRSVPHLRALAPLSIGLGPGFVAGEHVDCVIETNRGHSLGRCLRSGTAQADTGVPGLLGGETVRRVLRAPCDGIVDAVREIGELVRAGETVARVGDGDVRSELDGVVRGMIHPGLTVRSGQKIGDVDPRGDADLCRRISDKALAIAGGVLEAILSTPSQ